MRIAFILQRFKRIRYIGLVFTVLFAIAGCQGGFVFDYNFEFDSAIMSEDRIEKGCEKFALDSAYGDFVMCHEGWVYFDESYKSHSTRFLHRARPDGSEKQEMPFNATVLQSVYHDGWIYWLGRRYEANDNVNTSSGLLNASKSAVEPVMVIGSAILFRMRLDGSECTRLAGVDMVDGSSDGKFVLRGEWLYYQDMGSLRRTKLDGSEKQLITKECYEFVADADYIFVYQSGGLLQREVKRYSLGGIYEKTLLHHSVFSSYFYPQFTDGGFLYYSVKSYTMNTVGQFRRIQFDGKGDQAVIEYKGDISLIHFYVKNNYIYYLCVNNTSSYPYRSEIHVVNIDRIGTYAKLDIKEHIFRYDLSLYKLVGDSIFYARRNGDVYRVFLDGEPCVVALESNDTERRSGFFVHDRKAYAVVSPPK